MKKIILIEDNMNVRETTKEILELADYKVITAENGKKGVELVKSEKPDLIICDIAMPDLDGYGVLRILNRNPLTSGIPFVFLTAKTEKSDIRKGMNQGADDYITKPFKENELLEAVEMRLNKTEKYKQEVKSEIQGTYDLATESKNIEGLKNLIKNRKIQSYKRKESIFREDDFANYLFYIQEGLVKTIKTDTYGKDFLSDIFKEGEFFGFIGLMDGKEYRKTAIAMENSKIAIIPRDEFLNLLAGDSEVNTYFIKRLMAQLRDKEDRLLQMAYAPVKERVADTLIHFRQKEGDLHGAHYKLKISREDLASMVGTSKESLIRTLSEMKKEGLVDTDGQDIDILDEKGLNSLVSF